MPSTVAWQLHGYGRLSRKLPGVKLRRVVLADGRSYWLRPSFALPYMTGTVEELACPLLLAVYGVPPWLLTKGFGHSDMYWYRLIERLGQGSLVGTTVRHPSRLPAHLAADEHHVDWAGQKGYVATSVGIGIYTTRKTAICSRDVPLLARPTCDVFPRAGHCFGRASSALRQGTSSLPSRSSGTTFRQKIDHL